MAGPIIHRLPDTIDKRQHLVINAKMPDKLTGYYWTAAQIFCNFSTVY